MGRNISNAARKWILMQWEIERTECDIDNYAGFYFFLSIHEVQF